MSRSIFIFDACSLINLFHIDEDDLLYNEILKHNIFIAEEVINEVKRNVFRKFKLLDTYKISYEDEKKDEINEKIGSLIRFQVENKRIIEECGNLFEECKKFNKYYKVNGEFISTCLALLKSRKENHIAHFYTDDYPAIKTLQNYFNYQKIGFIQDSVDLLIFLYWSSAKINLPKLKNFLSLLLYEYNIELKLLLEQIRNRKEVIQRLIKDKNLSRLLYELEYSLSTFKLNKLSKIKSDIMNYKKMIPDFITMFDSFSKIFEIENDCDENLFGKIKNSIGWLNDYEILKLHSSNPI